MNRYFTGSYCRGCFLIVYSIRFFTIASLWKDLFYEVTGGIIGMKAVLIVSGLIGLGLLSVLLFHFLFVESLYTFSALYPDQDGRWLPHVGKADG